MAYASGGDLETVLAGWQAGRSMTNLAQQMSPRLQQALMQACFCGEMLLEGPGGTKRIDAIEAGERVLARDEHDVNGEVEAKTVEAVFRRWGRVGELHLVDGQVIRTTLEHPFFEQSKGWVACGVLEEGDWLSLRDGRWVRVERVVDTGREEWVYHLRVADYHTYFVSATEWGVSVWAHNLYTRRGMETLLADVGLQSTDFNVPQLVRWANQTDGATKVRTFLTKRTPSMSEENQRILQNRLEAQAGPSGINTQDARVLAQINQLGTVAPTAPAHQSALQMARRLGFQGEVVVLRGGGGDAGAAIVHSIQGGPAYPPHQQVMILHEINLQIGWSRFGNQMSAEAMIGHELGHLSPHREPAELNASRYSRMDPMHWMAEGLASLEGARLPGISMTARLQLEVDSLNAGIHAALTRQLVTAGERARAARLAGTPDQEAIDHVMEIDMAMRRHERRARAT